MYNPNYYTTNGLQYNTPTDNESITIQTCDQNYTLPETFNVVNNSTDPYSNLFLTPFEEEFNLLENSCIESDSLLYAPMEPKEMFMPEDEQKQCAPYSHFDDYRESENSQTSHNMDHINLDLLNIDCGQDNSVYNDELYTIKQEDVGSPSLFPSDDNTQQPGPSNSDQFPSNIHVDPYEFSEESPNPPQSHLFASIDYSNSDLPSTSSHIPSSHIPSSHIPSSHSPSPVPSTSGTQTSSAAKNRQAQLRELNNQASREYRRRKKEKERQIAEDVAKLEASIREREAKKKILEKKVDVLSKAISGLWQNQSGGVLYDRD